MIGLVERGVAPDRIGVFYPSPAPYVRIIEQQFGAAGLAINGPDPRRLADSVAGRTLISALEMPQVRWRRDRVMALVSGGPIRVGDRRARPVSWDRLTREAGVVGDLGDWSTKLDRHRSETQARLDEIDVRDRSLDADGEVARIDLRRTRHVDRIADIAEIEQFVGELSMTVSEVTSAPTWPEKCALARKLLVQLLGPENQHTGWPEPEQDAFGRVDEALGRLAVLDDIEAAPSHAVFLRALRSEFEVARGRRGRFGHGVFYGPLTTALGHDFDAVFVLGAAEGLLPAPRRDDAILPDRVRLCSLDQLEPRIARLHHQHRAFLAALATAPHGDRTLFFPRGSLRSSRRALPSRWLLDTASALAGKVVHATDFDTVSRDVPGVVETIGSFSSGIMESGHATGVDERDLVAIGLDSDAIRHPLGELAGSGLTMQAERSSDRLSAFDGNLAGADTTLGDRAISPSRLETWASCGFRYFLRYVLDVGDRDDPERTDDISALDRGNLVHAILEQFIGEAIDRGAP
ncbi:MAG: PD-(D/E)XK nuclease family protein, partial [Saprospiraceae bacterium]